MWDFNVEEMKREAFKFEGFLSGFKVTVINWILVFVTLAWNGLEGRKKPSLDSA